MRGSWKMEEDVMDASRCAGSVVRMRFLSRTSQNDKLRNPCFIGSIRPAFLDDAFLAVTKRIS